MAVRKLRLSNKMRLILPPILLFVMLFAWMGFSIWLDHQAEQKAIQQSANSVRQTKKDTVVSVDNTFTVLMPCSNPDGPGINDQEGVTTTTYTCIFTNPDGSTQNRYYTSNKIYNTGQLTAGIEYDFCGTYTDGDTQEIMKNISNTQEIINGKQFRFCEYSGDKDTWLLTAKAISGESLQTYSVIGKASAMQGIEPVFRKYVDSLRYIN